MRSSRLCPVLVAVLFLLAPGAAMARTYVNDGTGHPAYRPQHMLGGSGVACGVWRAKHLHWRHWGTTTARATGTVIVNLGEESCAGGPLKAFHATLRFFRPRSRCKLSAAPDWEPKPVPQVLFTRVDIDIPALGDGTWHTTPDQAGACG
jgi:hypothetical protein